MIVERLSHGFIGKMVSIRTCVLAFLKLLSTIALSSFQNYIDKFCIESFHRTIGIYVFNKYLNFYCAR